MPKLQSAKKELRKSIRRRTLNRAQVKILKNLIKEYRENPAVDKLPLVYKALDKATRSQLMKKNKAARLKGSLARLKSPTN